MKTVRLSPCKNGKFPDIPDLRFYQTEDDLFYFNATHCLGKADPGTEHSISDFLAKFDYLIGTLCQSNKITGEELLVQDAAGAVYLEECLAIPFMAYIDPWFGPYIVERMEELIRFGFTINDNFCRFFHKTRFEDNPSE